MRPIPAPRIGESHGLLRAIDERERLRLDEFVTDFSVDELFPPGLENALGRTRQFVSFARAAGLLKEDRGTVELTEIGKRYIRSGAEATPFEVSPGQAEWLRRQLREKHMTDSIYHGLAIGLSLLASSPGAHVSTLDFGRALAYLGRAGWDNENTLQIQGERHVALLEDIELIDGERRLTDIGAQTKADLTLPIHMSLPDIANQLNPGGPDAVRTAGEAEWSAPPAAPEPEATPAPPPAAAAAPEPQAEEEDEYADVGPGAWAAGPTGTEETPAAPVEPPAAPPAPPEPPADVWDVAAPDDATRAISAVPVPPPEPEPEPEPEPAAPPAAEPDAFDPLAPPPGLVRTEEPAPLEAPTPAPAAPGLVGAADPADAATVISPSPSTPGFEDDIERAAAERGLRLEGAVYASVAAALASDRHVVLVGPPGAGKTALALAVAKAAVDAGKADGAMLAAGADEALATHVANAARRNRWLVVDDLRDAAPLAPLAAFLGHLPVTLPGDEELRAPADWRMIATADAPPAGAPAALASCFAFVSVTPHPDLEAAIADAAAGDATAAAAVRRLLPLRDVAPLGAGPFLAAARHAAERNRAAPADERTLAREVLDAYLSPLLDEDARARARQVAGA